MAERAPAYLLNASVLVCLAKIVKSKSYIPFWLRMVLRSTIRGKRVDLGLGGWPYVFLSSTRQSAFEYRKLVREGGDPRSLSVPPVGAAYRPSRGRQPMNQ